MLKTLGAIATVGAIMAAMPASAALLIAQVDVTATGYETVYSNNQLISKNPVTRTFMFDVDVADMAIGSTRSFSIGANLNDGVRSGTITQTGFDQWGNQAFAGSSFTFRQSQFLTDGFRDVELTASSFAVNQKIPAPVPEPATWAMMMLGFGAVGYAMRKRKAVVRFA